MLIIWNRIMIIGNDSPLIKNDEYLSFLRAIININFMYFI